jgi:membrane protein implicated in regulation of membrane protease activity
VGQRALAREALQPGQPGHVTFNGEIWKARSEQPVPAGSRVVVRGVHGLVLEVAPDGEGAPPAATSGALHASRPTA